jgi:enamine deaminase RidA (YjgF/YER057c/UK114 family)|tara:strand:- start:2053 stop:2454 length:402 start_codon:yes stop_codon:yes gene_type:complete
MTSKRTHVFSGSIYEELAGYARAVVVDDWIFVSGTVGVDFETGQMAEGSETQTSTALDTIEKALLEAESGLHDIVRVRVYVPDPEDVMVISGVLKARVGFTYPTNTTICSPLAVPGAKVEIEVEAIRGSGTAK